jgi:hypothetical protein|tara:strand:- start:3445 stop:3993 length:549 start_codon:yes stop_codon:yes gene_type:complete
VKYFLPVFLVFLLSCNQEPVTIYSNIDGLNHEEILSGPETLEKHSLELIYKIDTTLSNENFQLLIKALNNSSDELSPYYFNALTFYCNNLEINQNSDLEAALFNYFIYHPKSFIFNIKKMRIENSDCFLIAVSNYIHQYLIQNEITIISMKNLAYKYCKECSNEEIKFIYDYLDLANNFQKE